MPGDLKYSTDSEMLNDFDKINTTLQIYNEKDAFHVRFHLCKIRSVGTNRIFFFFFLVFCLFKEY